MNLKGQHFIGLERSGEISEFFTAINPATNEAIGVKYHTASQDEINRAVSGAAESFAGYSAITAKQKALFLTLIADLILEAGDHLIAVCTSETGLPAGRILGERTRTINQIRLFADLVLEGSWVEAAIDTAIPERQPAPRPDIRSMLIPIGPVVVFGAGNFPLAFSVAGGDTISALAGGNPVIVKAHPAHPGTSEIIADCITEAAKRSGMPGGIFSLLFDTGYNTGKALVMHPQIRAVAFTGSFAGGKALYDLAQTRPDPIPVFAEMSSVNPIFILPEALKKSAGSIAKAIAGSVTLGAGQFCTNPGLLFLVNDANSGPFLETLGEEIKKSIPQTMLTPEIAENYQKKVSQALAGRAMNILMESTEHSLVNQSKPLIALVSGADFEQDQNLASEVFGPYSLVVSCSSMSQMVSIARSLQGQLTATIFHDAENDPDDFDELPGILKNKAGRLIFNGIPTGVEVCHAMNHGGPFPASTDSRFTSVGTSAIKRFVRPVAFQDCPQSLLPTELRDGNPLNIIRLINGKRST
jgi:2,5-dioxopentanoate dehydrogenase